jgi:hypothetical protein
MNATDMNALEARAAKAGVSVAAILREAAVNQTQWVRGKNGTASMRPETWERITAAADRVIGKARTRPVAARRK